MIDIKKRLSGNRKKIGITAAFFASLALLLFVIMRGGSLPAAKKILKEDRDPEALTRQLDKLINSINQKSAVGILTDTDIANENPAEFKVSLNGIIWDADEPLALVNDNIVGIGDKVEGHRVVGIDQKSVTLEDEAGKRWVFFLS